MMQHRVLFLDHLCVLNTFFSSFKKKKHLVFWEIQYEIFIIEIGITFSNMGICFKYLTIFLKTEKLDKLVHFHHKNEKLYIPVMLKRLMTGIIQGTHVGSTFLPWLILIKWFKYKPSGFYFRNGNFKIK